MNWIRLMRPLYIILLGVFLLSSCSSGPRVDEEELLSRRDRRDSKGSIFVSPTAHQRIYQKVAVMPFRAPVELVGSSISDMFATEILKTYKYQLVERSQMEQVLGEQALGLKGVTDSALAMKVGKLLGIQGVIVGTIPEYGSKASGSSELAAIGINIRMIDVSDGGIVWSITDSAISDKPISISSFAKRMIDNMVDRLLHEWIKAGDTHAANLPSPQIISSYGKIRGAVIEIQPDSSETIRECKILRSRTKNGVYQEAATLESSRSRNIRFEDRDLLDSETYYYKVTLVSRTGLTSPPAGPVEITTSGPPGSVTGLFAESGLIRKVILHWQSLKNSPESATSAVVSRRRSRRNEQPTDESQPTDNDKNIKGYHIYRKSPAGSWLKIKTLEGTSNSTYTDEGLEDNKTYSYRIVAFNIVGTEGPPSQVITATTKGAPSPVKNFIATNKEAKKVPLSWSPVNEPEVKGYAIYRADKENGPFERIKFVEGKNQSQYVDGGKKGIFSDEPSLQDETSYFYKIQAVNVVDVHSPDSLVISAVTKPLPLSVIGLQVSQFEIKQVSLSWKPSQETDITKYEIFRGDDPRSINKHLQNVLASITHFIDKDLKDGTKYYYQVRAVDKDGLIGKFSEVISSSTKPIPKRPQGLRADFGGNQVKITWQQNPETDIKRYVVFKKGFLSWDKAGESMETNFVYQEEFKKGKGFTFRIIAIDHTNLESEPSEEVSITIP